MDSYRETAFCLTLWYAVLTVLVAILLIALSDLDVPTALLAAANVALLFALTLIVRTSRLNERRIERGQFWRTVPARARPPKDIGLRMARVVLEETWLRFAKGAAAAAIILSCLAYASHESAPAAWAKAASAHGMAHVTPD